jgi:hypothetical protein
MKNYVKTTVELPDELVVAAKKHAAELRRPLRELIEAGLRDQLNGPRQKHRRTARRRIRWVTVDGGLPEGLDPANRGAMHDYLRRGRA